MFEDVTNSKINNYRELVSRCSGEAAMDLKNNEHNSIIRELFKSINTRVCDYENSTNSIIRSIKKDIDSIRANTEDTKSS